MYVIIEFLVVEGETGNQSSTPTFFFLFPPENFPRRRNRFFSMMSVYNIETRRRRL